MILDRLFFYPDSADYGGHPSVSNYRFDEVYVAINPETRLHGWFVPSQEQYCKATIIHFHGNAANITDHWVQVDWIPKKGYNLFTFDYRGFGKSSGSVSFSGINEDCQSVISYVRRHLDNTGKIILLGQSIGGAFCLSAARQDKNADIKGIVIDSCFDSFRNISASKLSMFPEYISTFASNILVSDKYSPAKGIDSLKAPMLFIHSESDQVVPFQQGLNLFTLASEPKKFLHIKNEDHISVLVNRMRPNMNVVCGFMEDCSR